MTRKQYIAATAAFRAHDDDPYDNAYDDVCEVGWSKEGDDQYAAYVIWDIGNQRADFTDAVALKEYLDSFR